MKTNLISLYILLITIFLSFEVAAQYQYIPMPFSNAQWRHRTTYIQTYSIHLMDHMFIIDGSESIVNGTTYKKLFQRQHTESGYDQTFQYPAHQPYIAQSTDKVSYLIREDNKRVYLYISGSEYLIYDFNLSVGDTIPQYLTHNYTYIIRSIDTINMYNALRKQFKAVYIQSPLDTITIIEGLGSDRGLILPGPPPAYPGNQTRDTFYCLTTPDFNYNPFNKPCYYIWPYGTPTSVSNTSSEKSIYIYPNPFTHILNIDSKESGSITIYNTLGAIVARQNITAGRNTVQTDALSNGVYFVLLKDEAGRMIHKEKLIK